jgi:adenylate kinase family enzyme
MELGRPRYRRIVVVGSSGAGKTTWARALAAARGCRHIELDELFWGPGWTQKSPTEFRRLVANAVTAETWVAEGNYSMVRDLVWSRADAVVWLNLGFARVLGRSLRRTLSRIVRREALWHGNRESLVRTLFSRESIVWWVITTYHRRRRQFAALRDGGEFPHLVWFDVRRPAQAERCLRALSAPHESPA